MHFSHAKRNTEKCESKRLQSVSLGNASLARVLYKLIIASNQKPSSCHFPILLFYFFCYGDSIRRNLSDCNIAEALIIITIRTTNNKEVLILYISDLL